MVASGKHVVFAADCYGNMLAEAFIKRPFYFALFSPAITVRFTDEKPTARWCRGIIRKCTFANAAHFSWAW